MTERISDSAPPLPPKKAEQVLPDVVAALVLGAGATRNYRDGDGVYVHLPHDESQNWHLAKQDFERAEGVAKTLRDGLSIRHVVNAMDVLRIRRHADRILRELAEDASSKKLAMLKDKGSSGWWRMVLPARAMKADGWRVDCTAAPVEFDSLLEYDAVFVQRLHDWESFYTLERLRGAGKRIVYDIDDDLFNITPDNPAYNTITRDDQLAAANCMRLADLVTTTTSELQRRLTNVLDGVSPLVVPNAWDMSDRWSDELGSPDGIKRIFWSGGASHGADWEECFEAVSQVMHERDDVRLVIMGYLPPCVETLVGSEPAFRSRVEFCGFRDPQTYYEMVHHVRAEVGLAPLRSTGFNAAKCLTGDAKVVTGGGILSIKDVAEGMLIWQEFDFQQVSASISYSNRETVKLRTKMGYTLGGTPHHRLRSDGDFVEMGTLKEGAFVDLSFFDFPDVPMVEVPFPLLWTKKLDEVDFESCSGDLMPRIRITPEWGRFLGFVLGDGHLGGFNDVRVSCDGQDGDVIDWLCDFAGKIGLVAKIKEKDSPRNVDVSIASRSLRCVLGKTMGFLGGRKKVLRVPEVIWHSPKVVVRDFLRGLFEADGCACRGSIGLTSKNLKLIEDVQFLLLGFGILCRIKKDYNKHYKKTYYTLVLQRQACDVFAKEVGFVSGRKTKKLETLVSKGHSNAFKLWKMRDEVVEAVMGRETVYDIQVPDGEYYLANGIVSHNSPIKYLEYACIGVPTVASDWLPYNDVINDNVNGRLVSGKDSWRESIEFFLDLPGKREDMVRAARRTCSRRFDLSRVARTWAELLCPE